MSDTEDARTIDTPFKKVHVFKATRLDYCCNREAVGILGYKREMIYLQHQKERRLDYSKFELIGGLFISIIASV